MWMTTLNPNQPRKLRMAPVSDDEDANKPGKFLGDFVNVVAVHTRCVIKSMN